MKSYVLAAVLSTAVTLSAAEYSTYIGDANQYHVARAIADPTGNTYIAGSRVLTSQSSEIFVMKLDAAGEIVLFATLSGKGSDVPSDLAIDPAGNMYVAGATSSPNFPLHNPYQSTPGPGFLVKFSPDASQLLYSTYFPEAVNALAVDSAGNAYITGTTFSPDFPVTPGLPAGPATMYGIAAASGAFLTKISAAGDRIVYSALMVGHGKDCGGGSSCFTSFRNTIGVAIAVDPSGAAYIAGNTDTNDLATPGAMVTKGTGAFVANVNATGTALSYLTYVGPTYYPFVPFTNPANTARAIAVDAGGNAYVAGSTIDPILPVTKGAYQTTYNGPTSAPDPPYPLPPTDAFVVKLNPSGTGVVWGTYIGGRDADVANAVSLDRSGNVWVAGTTASQDFPNTQGWSQGGDFVVALDPSGSSLTYAARFPNDTVAQSVAADPSGLVHVAGSTGLVSTIAPAQAPVSRIFGIANAAAGPATGRIVPVEVVAIYGPHIGPATPGAVVKVSIDGLNVPVLYASDSQINAVVPFGVGQSSAAVHVVSNRVAGPDFPAAVSSSADPEVFQNADRWAAAMNQDGTVNSADHPAPAGSVVSIWMTGLGYEPIIGGEVIAAGPLDLHCCEVSYATGLALVGRAEVLYGGLAPGLVIGVFQVNFRVPGDSHSIALVGYLEFTVLASGQSSLPVRIYAQ